MGQGYENGTAPTDLTTGRRCDCAGDVLVGEDGSQVVADQGGNGGNGNGEL